MPYNRFLIRMGVFSLTIFILSILLHKQLAYIFLNNIALNSLIVGVLLFGVAYSFRQIFKLKPEYAFIKAQTTNNPRHLQRRPQYLSSLITLLEKSKTLSTPTLRIVLDSLDARLHESRDIGRYLVGLLIFLGLLGTFWGLSLTIKSIADVISALPAGESAQVGAFLSQLKGDLKVPLAGMGVAFSSSLFGLAGSLILGFLELQSNQARNQFYNHAEEWLSTKVLSASLSNISQDALQNPSYVQALLGQISENLESLQTTVSKTEDERHILNKNLTHLTEKLSVLGDQRSTEKSLLLKVAEGIVDFQQNLKGFSEKLEAASFGLDEASQGHIRNLDTSLNQLLEVTQTNHTTLGRDLKNEIRVLTKTLTGLAQEDRIRNTG